MNSVVEGKTMNNVKNPGAAGTGTGTKREILRAAECVYCGYMIPAPGTVIPHELDVSSRAQPKLRCGRPGATVPHCWPKGHRTVSFIDGRLQYTPLPTEAGQASGVNPSQTRLRESNNLMETTMTTDKTSDEKINGGTLVRAAKKCDCKVPDVEKNDIQEDDEWTCSCGQGWRARNREDDDGNVAMRWRRISKRTRKPKAPAGAGVTAQTSSEKK